MNPIFSRTLKALCSVMAVAMLSACGGASSTVNPLTDKVKPSIAGSRIVAFGDALSDAGQTGGMRFTVNDGTAASGMTLAERLALNFGFPSMASEPASSTRILPSGAYSYAYGGALISSGTGSVASQIDAFVNAGNQLTDNDLVIITAGTQDIVDNAMLYYNNPTSATATQAQTNVATAAANLVTKIRRLTEEANAKHVLVIAPLNVARTPWGLAQGANYPNSSANYTFLEQLSVALEGDNSMNSFGSQLSLKLGREYPSSSSGLKVFLSDLSSYFNLMTGTTSGSTAVHPTFAHPTGSLSTYSAYTTAAGVALTNPDIAVCMAAPDPTVAPVTTTSCTVGTQINSATNAVWDYNTSVFSDHLNLTPAANRMLADYIFNSSGMGTMRTAGWR